MNAFERTVKIANELGLHARPSAVFVEVAGRFTSEILVSKDGGNAVNAKSILGLMTLAAEHGSSLLIRCEGADAEKAAETLEALVRGGFEV